MMARDLRDDTRRTEILTGVNEMSPEAALDTYQMRGVLEAQNDGICINCDANPSCAGLGEFPNGWGEPDFCKTCNTEFEAELTEAEAEAQPEVI